jgi:hypothetical protein
MWTWEKVQNEAFNPLKKSLTAAPVLALFDPGKVILLYTDASRWGLAGICRYMAAWKRTKISLFRIRGISGLVVH